MSLPAVTKFFRHHAPFVLRTEESLPEFTLAYETYGTLNEDASNAILLFHALTGSQHAAGLNTSVAGVGDRWTSECHVGWWDLFIGPRRALDTDKYFVICANFLGGCYGSTGPSSINPLTGKTYGGKFPTLRFADIVDAQLLLVDHLGITKLHAVVGSSVGGIMALSLATRYPDRVKNIISIGSGYPTTATTVANLTGLTTSNMSPYGFAFIAAHPGLAGNPMTMYMADDGNGTTTHRGVTRWTLVNGTWTKSPTTSTGAFTQLLNQTNGAFAVAAWSDGVNVQLAYTIGGTQCGGATSCVYRVTDSGSTQTSQAAFTVPSTNNALYRGITIAPHL